MTETAQEQPYILIVDDEESNRLSLSMLLDDINATLVICENGMQAIEHAQQREFSMVLCDIMMPEMDGFQTAAAIRKTEPNRLVPILFLTAANREETLVLRGYQSGAVDVLFKPLQPPILMSKIRIFLELFIHKKELQRVKAELEEKNERLIELSTTDPLTKIKNRRALFDNLSGEFSRAKRYELPLSILMFDIDHFKSVNDTLGHQFGDYVLKEMGVLLKSSTRNVDIVGRYGGEEFLVVLPNTDKNGAEKFVEILINRIREHAFSQDDKKRDITASFGIAMLDAKTENYEQLIERADAALYKAKHNGRDQWVMG